MGYSIAVQVNSSKLRMKAITFMQKQFVQWSAMTGEGAAHIRGPELGGDLSYESNRSRIGFDFSSGIGDLERQYIWCLVNWMALTFGSKSKLKGSSNVLPYYIYDGHDHIAVLVGDDWKSRPASMKNEKEAAPDGWYPWPYSDTPGLVGVTIRFCQNRSFGMRLKKAEKIIRTELARLTAEWQKEIAP